MRRPGASGGADPRGQALLPDSERNRLVEATAASIAERGFLELRLEDVAHRAGVEAGVAAEIFPGGIEECLAAAEEAILLEVVAAVGRTYSADRSEWESVIYGVRAVLELMAAQPGFAYLGYVGARQMAPGRVKEIYETGQRTLVAMLERGWEYSRPIDQPARAALGMLGGAQALVRRELVRGRPEQLPALLPDCVYIATVPFLGQEEALRLARRAEALAAR